MNLWIVLITLFTSTPATALQDGMSADADMDNTPVRYRGIDQLLAKFDAEADEDAE